MLQNKSHITKLIHFTNNFLLFIPFFVTAQHVYTVMYATPEIDALHFIQNFVFKINIDSERFKN